MLGYADDTNLFTTLEHAAAIEQVAVETGNTEKIDMDGTNGRVTSKRLGAGRKLWFQLRRKLPRFGVSLRIRARVVQATVCAALLCGAEIWSYGASKIRRFLRVFSQLCLPWPRLQPQDQARHSPRHGGQENEHRSQDCGGTG